MPVAQSDRVPDFESVGCRFDSYRAHQLLIFTALNAKQIANFSSTSGYVNYISVCDRDDAIELDAALTTATNKLA